VRVQRLVVLAGIGLLALLACSTLENGTIGIITGGDDSGPFNEPTCMEGGTPFCGPDPTEIVISEITTEGAEGGSSSTPTVLSKEPYSGGSMITLPQVSSDDVDILQATAFDSDGGAIIFGETLPLSVGGIDGITLDLFVQRMGQFAIMPSPLPSTLESPLTTIIENSFIFANNGGGTEAFIYDLLLWSLAENADGGETGISLPCTPLSIAPIEGTTFLLLICAEGTPSTAPTGACTPLRGTNSDLVAFQYDVSGESCIAQVCANVGSDSDAGSDCPVGENAWNLVAGGATVIAPSGDAFIVGGTRPKSSLGPSLTVVKVGLAVAEEEAGVSSVYTSFLKFTSMRQGAAAVWANPTGLVVLGGNVASGGSTGVEYLIGVNGEAGTSMDVPLGYPSDMTVGAGAAATGPKTVIMAGGILPDGSVSPMRSFDLTCMSGCLETGPDASEAGPADATIQEGGSADGSIHDAGAPEASSIDAGSPVLVPLRTAQGFAVSSIMPAGSTAPSPWAALFVGTEKDKFTHAFLVPSSGQSAVEVPLRNPKREGARAILTPIPSVVVIGGDTTMESYIPPAVPSP
jgi:hypothetical protein